MVRFLTFIGRENQTLWPQENCTANCSQCVADFTLCIFMVWTKPKFFIVNWLILSFWSTDNGKEIV